MSVFQRFNCAFVQCQLYLFLSKNATKLTVPFIKHCKCFNITYTK